MQFSNSLLIASVLAMGTVLASHAQIRVYDPDSGKSVAAPTQNNAEEGGGGITVPAPQPTVQVPAQGERTERQVKQDKLFTPDHIARGEMKPVDAPLGNAFIFITADSFTPALAANIKAAMEMPGLNVQVYAEDLAPKKYFELIARAKDQAVGLNFRVDSNAYMAFRFGVKDYRTIFYVDAGGTRRQYDVLDDFEKFMRHVKRVKRSLGNK